MAIVGNVAKTPTVLHMFLKLFLACLVVFGVDAAQETSFLDQMALLEKKLDVMQRHIWELEAKLESTKSPYNARTCHELMSSDPTLTSGMYFVDPDGWNVGDIPIYVHCSQSGETFIPHDSESRTSVGHCFDPGCYSRQVNYNATVRQMRALIELSQTCDQFIRYDCYSAVLEFDDIEYSWWNDRNGEPHYYWTGSDDTIHTCSCGIQGNCADPNLLCNCDSVAPAALFDEGYIQNKEQLPISRLNFGRTSAAYSSGEHTLGRLRCTGNYQLSPGKRPGSCADLWKAGHTLSGIYLVQPEGGFSVLTVYCDMSKLPDDEGQETLVGTADIKSQPVHFNVARETVLSTSNGAVVISYEKVYLNIGGAMNITSGRFTAPKRGIYSFGFHYVANKEPGVNTWVDLVIENSLVTTLHALQTGSAALRFDAMMEVGDVAMIQLGHGQFHIYPGRIYVVFTGSLIQEL